MTTTTLNQVSTTPVDASGVPKFRVTSTITVVRDGDLPFADIFLHTIVEPSDPKQDKFLRIANIHDLTTITRGRDAAIAALQTTYLSGSFVVEFNDVTTAASSKLVAQTRIDSLIADWIKYVTEFLIPTDFPLPAPESTLVSQAKNAFYLAKTTHAAAEATLTTANAASAEAQAAAARASTTYTDALARTNTCSLRQANATAMQTAENAFRTAMSITFKTAADTFLALVISNGTPSTVAFSAAVTAAANAATAELQNGKPLLDALVLDIANECAAEAAAVTAAAVAKTTADGTVATTQTAQTQAQAAATAAAAAEAAALAAVLVVCADFDPN